jgi:hypothetical protein
MVTTSGATDGESYSARRVLPGTVRLDAVYVDGQRYTGRRTRTIFAKDPFENDWRLARRGFERFEARKEGRPIRVSGGGQPK